MKQTPRSINDFKRGDIVTRLIPSAPLPGLSLGDGEDDDIKDRNFIGAPLRFLGIANGCVNLERYENPRDQMDTEGFTGFGGFMKMMMGQSGPISLPLDIWSEGWAIYIDPYSLDDFEVDGEPMKFIESRDKRELERELQDAIENEDFLEAARIQEQLDSLK